MRAFIAIELSDNIRSSLSKVQAHLKYSGADIKWVEEDNIHLTIKFLGEISEEKAAEIRQVLDKIACSFEKFELTIKDIGAFPKLEFPRVIWAGLDRGAKETSAIAAHINEEFSELGFELEARPFAPHATIGRVRSAKNKEALKEKILSISKTEISGIKPQIVSSITLFQSILTSKGPVYKGLHKAGLR